MNNNKLDKVIDILIEGYDGKEVWHWAHNKITNNAKRQMISEILNTMFCNGEYKMDNDTFKSSNWQKIQDERFR